MHHGRFYDSTTGEIVDTLNFVFYPGPASATGEDLLEIFPHGNPLLIERIMDMLLQSGEARLAEPGEFTRRSFENGKIDLVQAESVGELIHAQNLAALKNAQRLLSGELSARLRALRDQILELSALLELDVDFAEEEADPDYASWKSRLEGVNRELQHLMKGFESGKSLNRIPLVALFGAPNAGKSSLINALLGMDRLLVSARAGTTRDYVEVPFRLPGGLIHLVDTAGLGDAVDELDAAAMQRTRQVLERADFKIGLQDGTDSPAVAFESSQTFDLLVLTKSDLPAFVSRPHHKSVSSVTGEGLTELVDVLQTELFASGGADEETVYLAGERQFRAVSAAQERVAAALLHMEKRPAIEVLAFEVREAGDSMRALLGEISADDVLHRIFSSFCIGK